LARARVRTAQGIGRNGLPATAIRLAAALATLMAATVLWQVPAEAAAGAADGLSGVSCPSVRLCIAVGARFELGGQNLPLAERWNGRDWRVQSLPTVPGTNAELSAVSCPTATVCTAVGNLQTATTEVPLVEQWNGHAWHMTQSAEPQGATQVELYDVSCASANVCEAVGLWGTGTGLFHTLAERWNGHSWHLQNGAKIARSAVFAGVHCEGRSCMAVGYRENATNTELPMAQQWNGHRWSLVSAASPPRADLRFSILRGVWCISARSCFAVGEYLGATDSALAETWNGSRWRQQSLTAKDDDLSGISCTSAANCMAVGSGPTGSAPTGAVSQRWTGRWHAVSTPGISGMSSGLVSVSCPAPKLCVAVGGGSNGSNVAGGVTLAEAWNGRRWRVLRTVNP
jgi:hypothetical protein